jgi:hypothetical protein
MHGMMDLYKEGGYFVAVGLIGSTPPPPPSHQLIQCKLTIFSLVLFSLCVENVKAIVISRRYERGVGGTSSNDRKQ